ncbi:unnamed protein product, partial [Amoebophrya sp. A120]
RVIVWRERKCCDFFCLRKIFFYLARSSATVTWPYEYATKKPRITLQRKIKYKNAPPEHKAQALLFGFPQVRNIGRREDCSLVFLCSECDVGSIELVQSAPVAQVLQIRDSLLVLRPAAILFL